ncbi:MAG: glycosyltransferase family 4 protein [Halioglobus sp.]
MIALLVTLLLSVLFCGLYLRFARARQILAAPNERSSHTMPTPHGGGLPLLVSFILGLLIAAWLYGPWNESFVVLAFAALFLMLVGVVDDIRGLPMSLRLALYALVGIVVAALELQGAAITPGFWHAGLVGLAALIMLWSTNLYNFMDGIDGIAAIQAVLACCGAAWLSWVTGQQESYALFCLLFAAAHLGFLAWNLPPARLFMGDAGSLPTGFMLAGLALLGAVGGQLNALCWLVMLAFFITDASWTLVWRLCTGQPFTQAHRLHAYQRLSRHWDSHMRVDILLLVINTVWLFPLAALLQLYPDHALILVLLAYLPLLSGMAKIHRLA